MEWGLLGVYFGCVGSALPLCGRILCVSNCFVGVSALEMMSPCGAFYRFSVLGGIGERGLGGIRRGRRTHDNYVEKGKGPGMGPGAGWG